MGENLSPIPILVWPISVDTATVYEDDVWRWLLQHRNPGTPHLFHVPPLVELSQYAALCWHGSSQTRAQAVLVLCRVVDLLDSFTPHGVQDGRGGDEKKGADMDVDVGVDVDVDVEDKQGRNAFVNAASLDTLAYVFALALMDPLEVSHAASGLELLKGFAFLRSLESVSWHPSLLTSPLEELRRLPFSRWLCPRILEVSCVHSSSACLCVC